MYSYFVTVVSDSSHENVFSSPIQSYSSSNSSTGNPRLNCSPLNSNIIPMRNEKCYEIHC